MPSLKENSGWEFLTEGFYNFFFLFYYLKMNWLEHNQVLFGVNFLISHFVDISLVSVLNLATRSRPFLMQAVSARNVPKTAWKQNQLKTERTVHQECMAWCFSELGRARESSLSCFDYCITFGVGQKSLADSGLPTWWKPTFPSLEQW